MKNKAASHSSWTASRVYFIVSASNGVHLGMLKKGNGQIQKITGFSKVLNETRYFEKHSTWVNDDQFYFWVNYPFKDWWK